MHLKMSSAKWRLFGLGLNELSGKSWYQLMVNTMMLSVVLDVNESMIDHDINTACNFSILSLMRQNA